MTRNIDKDFLDARLTNFDSDLNRLPGIMEEFLKGFTFFRGYSNIITVFGSARFPEGHAYYEEARELTFELSKIGYTIVTGGGPGIMEAANRGAFEAGGPSLGVNIELPMEQKENPLPFKLHRIKTFFLSQGNVSKVFFSIHHLSWWIWYLRRTM